MASQKRFDLENKHDREVVLRMLMEEDESGEECEDYSDAEEDAVERREDNTDTEQETDSKDSDSDDHTVGNYFLGRNKSSKWSKVCPPKNVRTRRQNIVTHLPGVKGVAKNARTPQQCWSCFFDNDVLSNIVKFTNEKISRLQENYSRERDAHCTDIIEVKALLGILYICASRKDNHANTKEIWSADKMGIELCRLIMSEKRFKFLLYCLRFDNIETRQERKKYDNLAPIREVFSLFVENCKNAYSVGEYCTIDEKLEAFRGKCFFRQYIPSKPNKYGIKLYALVDARMYYTVNMEIYAGKQPAGQYEISNKPADVVKRLSSVICGTGRNITVDNWFTSLDLANFLLHNNLTLVGTMRKNKPEIPPEFTQTKTREVGSSLFGFEKNSTLMSYVAKKNKVVLILSTMHHDDAIDETSEKNKPKMITFYNATKSGVDTVDQLCSTYNVARKTNRWPMVILYSMINVAAINAQIVYHANNESIKTRRSEFLKLLGRSLADDFLRRRSKCSTLPRNLKQDIQSLFSDEGADQPTEEVRGTKRQRCSECGRSKNRYTKYQCRSCKKFLCLEHAQQICADC